MRLLILALPLLLAGCLPITVSVAPDGRIALARAEGIFAIDLARQQATLVQRCPAGQVGAWARWDAGGKRLLVATYEPARERWRLSLIRPGATGPGTLILETEDPLGYATVSPTGTHVAVVVAPPMSRPLLTIHEASSGKQVTQLDGVSTFHAWTPDGSGVFILKIARRDKAGVYHGDLLRHGVDGRSTRLLAVATRQRFHLDRGGGRLSIVALGVAAGETARPVDDSLSAGGRHTYLFLYTLADGGLRRVPALHPTYAVFSPSGNQLLVDSGQRPESLMLVDAAGARPARVLTKALAVTSERLGDQVPILPVWSRDASSVIFWRYQPTVGVHGRSLRTRRLTLSDGRETDLEHVFERMVYAALGR